MLAALGLGLFVFLFGTLTSGGNIEVGSDWTRRVLYVVSSLAIIAASVRHGALKVWENTVIGPSSGGVRPHAVMDFPAKALGLWPLPGSHGG